MPVTLEKAIAILRANQEMLRERGVVHAAIFGSVARGDARPDSDVDIMVDIDPDRHLGVYDFVSIQHQIEDLLEVKIDLAEGKALKPLVKAHAMSEKIDVF